MQELNRDAHRTEAAQNLLISSKRRQVYWFLRHVDLEVDSGQSLRRVIPGSHQNVPSLPHETSKFHIEDGGLAFQAAMWAPVILPSTKKSGGQNISIVRTHPVLVNKFKNNMVLMVRSFKARVLSLLALFEHESSVPPLKRKASPNFKFDDGACGGPHGTHGQPTCASEDKPYEILKNTSFSA